MNVYIVQHRQFVKIGKAKDVQKRIGQLQISLPTPIKLLHVISCDSERKAYFIERSLHLAFDDFRASGEWFRFTGALKRFIRFSISGDIDRAIKLMCQMNPGASPRHISV
jgi:hypothetical protein